QPSKNSEGTYSATADASHVCLGSTLADVQRFHYARSAQAANLDASDCTSSATGALANWNNGYARKTS
ncbi:MAG TPA: hypothetical protein VIY49_18405, partial [Bryobacteraceae bacterium]